MNDAALLRQAARLAAESGLMLRGGFHPDPGDAVPPLPDGEAAGTLLMLGNAGPALWQVFHRSREFRDGAPDPLDRWTRRTAGLIAERLGAAPLLPFGGPPWHPFQRWAMRAEAVAASPLGILIHPEFGLWHAYRAALAFGSRLALPPRDERPSPCTRCRDRPCLSACPVGAFAARGYDVEACTRHLDSAAEVDCMQQGCRARRACPIGTIYAPDPEPAEFHMRAFRAARRQSAHGKRIPDH